MRKLMTSLFVLVLLLNAACKKSAENIIDCFGESLLVHIQHTADGTNSKLINFELEYSGSHSIKSIEWQFGDGSTATSSGTSTTHTYTGSGEFKVIAKVSIQNGNSTCSPSPEKTFTVN